jgi:hypothetical protein
MQVNYKAICKFNLLAGKTILELVAPCLKGGLAPSIEGLIFIMETERNTPVGDKNKLSVRG